MTATLDRVLPAADAGVVADGRPADPDPEVPQRARRRTFTAKYKLEVLAAYDAAGPGEKGAILRREGLYSAIISEWRRARDRGRWPRWPSPRRPAADPRDGADRPVAGSARSGWSQELDKARNVIEVQGKLSALLEQLADDGGHRDRCETQMIDAAVAELAPVVGVRAACAGDRASPRPAGTAGTATARCRPGRNRFRTSTGRRLARWTAPSGRRCSTCCTASASSTPPRPRSTPRCSTRASTSARCPTMYRILRAHGEVRERRRQATHPATVKPELLATAPNEVWSWDITKLLGPAKWTYFYLYVILDIFSRYVVGWMVATSESRGLAEALIGRDRAPSKASSPTSSPSTPTVDRSMTTKPVASCSPTWASPRPTAGPT